MKAARILAVAVVLAGESFTFGETTGPTAQMREDVARLVQMAGKLKTLWPWQTPLPEVAVVAAHGPAVGRLLVAQLADNPEDDVIDWHVQQQVALALCKIYGVSEEAGHVFMNRASAETNGRIKAFWVAKMTEQ